MPHGAAFLFPSRIVCYYSYLIAGGSHLAFNHCSSSLLDISMSMCFTRDSTCQLVAFRFFDRRPEMIPNRGPLLVTGDLLLLYLLLLDSSALRPSVSSTCPRTCNLALGSYYLSRNSGESNLTYVSGLFGQTVDELLLYNPNIPNTTVILPGTRVNVSFSCDCLYDSFLGHTFSYTILRGNTYSLIAEDLYGDLPTVESLAAYSHYPERSIPVNANVTVTVNCSCWDPAVSNDYDLFITYRLRPGERLWSVAKYFGLSEALIRSLNPGANADEWESIVFIPAKELSHQARRGFKDTELNMEKSVEFTYEELATATNGFSMSNQIDKGGFGAVYYAELRGEKAAIKKMHVKATREFLAELKVLTHVHHLNLVRLIGYCIEGSLFLVYEYIDNGNLSQHLHSLRGDPLSWPARVQIALDSARGLEYIHEHTVPIYIHRDIKSANILIDKKLCAKVADFGLTKLTRDVNMSQVTIKRKRKKKFSQDRNVMMPTRLVGTFGYMPPEYARYSGAVSPKVDVYAFGVVLFELISSKEAVVTSEGLETKGLVSLFQDALIQPNPTENILKLVDPRLGDDYPIDSVLKMVQIARACTEVDPRSRPTMGSVVVALMALSSSAETLGHGKLPWEPCPS